MLQVYREFCEKYLCMPVIAGKKTESDKFAGAVSTYAIEALMHDGKALQAGTSHYFGDGFAKAFGIQYTSKDNKLEYPHQTSWGMTTRLIGAIIMTHGDDNGLILPPAVAPTQIVVIPVQQHKEGVLEKSESLAQTLRDRGYRVKLDDSDNSPGWKFAEYEMKGVPLRIEMGPRDIAENKCVCVSRATTEKTFISLDEIADKIPALFTAYEEDIYNSALKNRENRTYEAKTADDINAKLKENGDGFIKAMWCGDEACEDKITELTGVKSRCIPEKQEHISDVCVCCGKPANTMVYWAKAY
jgi:prolyl-tRNA synthetase